ncbi:TPA: hypothetical protein DEG75_04265 [Candidatus Dependentiae bacterium]|nr:hypothetical protein [Candidatus Dependentiae bacterium]
MVLLGLLGFVVVIGIWFMQGYNALVRVKALLDEAWSGIDVQLKRRYDLIPNLVAVVKQYSIHEKEVLENIARMRSLSMQATDVAQKAQAEGQLTSALKTLFAVAENYPQLKANENFMSLQTDLGALEQDLQLARRYYNGAARNFNVLVNMFPSRIIAGITGFVAAKYFELDSAEERNAPRIQF